MSEPLRVLFVCTANISRSPFMELTARSLAGEGADVVFASAGTHGFDARAMDEAMVPLLPGDAVGAEHASRRLTREIMAEADVVLTAESAHRTFILEEFPQHFRKVFTRRPVRRVDRRPPRPQGTRAGRGGRGTTYVGASRARHRRPLPARGCGRSDGSQHNVEYVERDRSATGGCT